MGDRDTEYGILIKATEQARSIVDSVNSSLKRLEAGSKSAANGSAALNGAHKTLGATFAAVNQQISAASPVVGRITSQMEGLASVATRGGGILAETAVAFVTVGAAAVTAAVRIGEYQNHMDNAALTTGLTQGQLGGLTVAAARVGKSFSDVLPALNIFTRNLQAAKEGSGTAVLAYSRLRDENGRVIDITKKTNEVFAETVRALALIPDAGQRARIATELFGRSAAQLIPILMQNQTETEALAEKLGIVLTPAQQKVAREADKANAEMKLSFVGLANVIGIALAPLGTTILKSITEFINALRGLQRQADSVKGESIAAQLDIIGNSADRNEKKVKAMKDELIRLQMQGREGGFGAPDLSNVPGFKEGAASQAWRPGKLSTGAPGPDAGPLSQYAVGLLQAKEVAKEVVSTAHELTDAQLQQLTASKKAIELLADKVRWGTISLDQEFAQVAAMREAAISLEEVRVITERIAKIGALEGSGRVVAEKARILTRGAEEASKTLPGIPGMGTVRRSLQQYELYNPDFGIKTPRAVPSEDTEALLKSKSIAVEAQRAISAFNGEFAKMRVEVEKAGGTWAKFGAQMAHVIHDVVGNEMFAFFMNIKNGFKDLGENIRDLILGIMAQIAAEAATRFVMGLIFPGLQGGGTLLAQAGGTVWPVRAQSGVVMSGMRGMDTVPLLGGRVLGGKGETVLSHDLTDLNARVMRKMDAFLNVVGRPQPNSGQDRQPSQPQRFEFHFHGQFMDKNSLGQFAEEVFVPIMLDKIVRGSYRGRA